MRNRWTVVASPVLDVTSYHAAAQDAERNGWWDLAAELFERAASCTKSRVRETILLNMAFAAAEKADRRMRS
jgi:hypothetical protein